MTLPITRSLPPYEHEHLKNEVWNMCVLRQLNGEHETKKNNCGDISS